MAKFLDSEGLLYFWGKIKSWVEAKGYTTNTGTITSVKTTAGAHTTINKTSGAAEFNVPTKTSHLTNDSNFITLSDVPEGVQPSTTTPLMDGTAATGTETKYARGDHRHPTDTTRVEANTAITAGTHTKITYDSKGLVTGGSDLSASDIPNLTLSKITDVTATAAELNIMDGVTATTAELNYVDGVTSNILTQLNAKAPKASPALTGTPTAPTAAAGTNTTLIATTAFVTTALSNAEVISSVDTTAGTSGINLSLDANKKLDVTITSGSVASGNTNFVTGGTVYSTTSLLAPKASPALTGTPTAPTAAAGTNTTQIATTAFVTSAIATASAGLASFQGTVDAASTITGSSYKKGWYWVVQTAGTYVGQTCEAGDMIFAIKDKGSAYAASDFSVVLNNMDMLAITNTEIDTITAA